MCWRDLHRFVDPCWSGQRRWYWHLANKTFRVSGVRNSEHTFALDLDAVGVAEVDGGWGVEAEPGVSVLVVVPPEEALAERAAIFGRAESSRKLWAVLERLELRF